MRPLDITLYAVCMMIGMGFSGQFYIFGWFPLLVEWRNVGFMDGHYELLSLFASICLGIVKITNWKDVVVSGP